MQMLLFQSNMTQVKLITELKSNYNLEQKNRFSVKFSSTTEKS